MNKKLVIMTAVGVLIVLTLLLSALLANKESQSTDIQANQDGVVKKVPSSTSISTNKNTTPKKETTQSNKSVVPRRSFTTVVDKIETRGSSLLLYTNTGEGNQTAVKIFKLTLDTVVFNSNKGMAIQPDTLIQGTKVTIYSKGTDASTQLADAVVIGDKAQMIEVGIIQASSIINSSMDVQLNLTDDTLVFNALSGRPFDMLNLKERDAVFYYIQPPSDVAETPLTKGDKTQVSSVQDSDSPNPNTNPISKPSPSAPIMLEETNQPATEYSIATQHIVSEIVVYPR